MRTAIEQTPFEPEVTFRTILEPLLHCRKKESHKLAMVLNFAIPSLLLYGLNAMETIKKERRRTRKILCI